MAPMRRPWMITILILPVALALLWTLTAGYPGVNGQDAHDYWRIAREWTAFCAGGERPVLAEHPHGYPIAGALVGAITGGELIGLRVVSVLALIGLACSMVAVLRRSVPSFEVIPYPLLAIAASPFLLRYSMMAMSDVLGIALIFLTYALVVRWQEGSGRRYVLVALCCATAAMAVRLAAAPLLGAMVLALFYERTRARRTLWVVLTSVGAIAMICMSFIGDEARQLYLHGTPLAEWSPLNVFRRVLRSDDGMLTYRFPNLVYVLGIIGHPGFLPIGILLLPFFRKADLVPVHARIAVWCLATYLLFIAGMPFQNDRVLLMALPFVVVLFFPAFQRAWVWLAARKLKPALWASVAVIVQFGLFIRAIQPFIEQARTERDLATEVNALHPPMIYTHGMGAALSNYCAPVPVTELWYTTLEHFEPGGVVVVKPANLFEQWSGHPPDINWERIKAQGIEPVAEHPDGWVIVRVR